MASSRPLSELVPQQKYMVLHTVGNQSRPRSSCMVFLEAIVPNRYVFSARPAAGTTILYTDDILDFVNAPVGMKAYVNKIETVTEWPMEPEPDLSDTFELCETCGLPMLDGTDITIVTDARVFNGGEIEHGNTWKYHSDHVQVAERVDQT